MTSAAELIAQATQEGKTPAEIQALLRAGFDIESIPVQAIIQALALGLEELLTISVKLFAEAVKLMGADVDAEGMARAYLEGFRISQDATLYDLLHEDDDAVEAEVVEIPGQTTIDEQIAEVEDVRAQSAESLQ